MDCVKTDTGHNYCVFQSSKRYFYSCSNLRVGVAVLVYWLHTLKLIVDRGSSHWDSTPRPEGKTSDLESLFNSALNVGLKKQLKCPAAYENHGFPTCNEWYALSVAHSTTMWASGLQRWTTGQAFKSQDALQCHMDSLSVQSWLALHLITGGLFKDSPHSRRVIVRVELSYCMYSFMFTVMPAIDSA